jgi:hypothetical protein
MKKILQLIALFTLMLVVSSCEKWLDVNQSPNTASGETMTQDYLFTYASTAYSANRTGGDLYIPLVFMNQAMSDAQSVGWSSDEDIYDISTYSTGNTWKMYYSTATNNLLLAIDIAKKENNNNAVAQCKILQANLMWETTVIWGDIPFSEAWQASISYPKFDTQEEVLNGVIALLDEALALIDPSSPLKIGAADLYYTGNMDKWSKLAKSLKLRVLFTMVDKDPSKAAAIGALITAGGMISSADDNWTFPFFDEPDKGNPKYRLLAQYFGGTNTEFYACQTVFDPMDSRNDPRIPQYFDIPVGGGGYAALSANIPPDKDGNGNPLQSRVSLRFFQATSPDVLFTYQEQLLFEAEAYARGLGVAQDISRASTLYKSAVEAACIFNGVTAADAATYVASANLPTLTSSNAVEEIHWQQWIDLMDRPLEGWVQSRRSGPDGQEIPQIVAPAEAPQSGVIMRRWPYSDEESTGNINCPDQYNYWDKMWFDL